MTTKSQSAARMKDIFPSSPVPSLWCSPATGFPQDLQCQACAWGADLRPDQKAAGHPHNLPASATPVETASLAGRYCSTQSPVLVGNLSYPWPASGDHFCDQKQLMPTAAAAAVSLSSSNPILSMRVGDCGIRCHVTLYLKEGANLRARN